MTDKLVSLEVIIIGDMNLTHQIRMSKKWQRNLFSRLGTILSHNNYIAQETNSLYIIVLIILTHAKKLAECKIGWLIVSEHDSSSGLYVSHIFGLRYPRE
jgi:hypothetical protein